MSASLRVALEAIARPIIALYLTRSGDASLIRRSAQSMTRIVTEMLQLGCTVHASPAESVRLSPTQQWIFAVESILRQIDRETAMPAAAVLVLRLTRPLKTESSSFGRIAEDINVALGATVIITTEEAEGLYRAALQRFAELLNERNVGRDIATEPRCATSLSTPGLDPQEARSLIRIGQRLQRMAHQVRARRSHRRIVTVIPAAEAAELYVSGHPAARRGGQRAPRPKKMTGGG